MPTLNLPDATVFFDQTGHAGPRVMMVQGAGVIGEGWRGIVNLLAGDHQLAWHDNRGVGQIERRHELSLGLGYPIPYAS